MNRIPPSLDPLPPQPPPAAPSQRARLGFVERVHEALHRHRFVLAPISFGLGVASFFLISRKVYIAQWLAIFLLATWLLSVLELALPKSLRLPQGLLRFITQQTHQEAFFFTLPFLWKTTSWYTGQAYFTGGVIVAAVCSMWDPLYFGVIVQRRWLYLVFHALAVYLVMLVGLPMLLQLTTTQTLMLAAIAVGLVAAPSLAQPEERAGQPIGLLIFAMGLALGAAAWVGRAYVPPATLWIAEAAITSEIDLAAKAPRDDLDVVPATQATHNGVWAYTVIRAPRGLRESVFHEWYEDGKFVVSVPLEISGDREQGYRTWSHKTGFSGATERWKVKVVTESGQMLGELRFSVGDVSEQQRVEQPIAPAEREPAGDQRPDQGADHESGVTPSVPAPDRDQPDGDREQRPQREQVNPAEVPGTQRLDEQRRSGDDVHQREPDAPAASMPERALGGGELNDAEPDRERRREQVKPDDSGNAGHDEPAPSPAPSAPESSTP